MKQATFRSIAVLMFFIVPVAVSCTPAGKNDKLNPHAYKAAINEKTDEVLLDVRTPGEYADGHLANAVNADWLNNTAFATAIEKLDKNKPVFVYCQSGRRSSEAVKHLEEAGFKEVYELDGGFHAWLQAGMKTNKDGNELQGMNMDTYHHLLDTDKLVLVDFYATWCTPCTKMNPFLKEIAEEQAQQLVLHKINADKNTLVARELNISGLPTILLYKSKKLVWSHVGYINKSKLLEKITTFN